VGARPAGLRRREGPGLVLVGDGRLHDQGAPRGKKTGKTPTDRGKEGARRRLLVEADGTPVGLAADGANGNDLKLTRATLEVASQLLPLVYDDLPAAVATLRVRQPLLGALAALKA
jgi:hypothetical protein